jgi:hypothetical protein
VSQVAVIKGKWTTGNVFVIKRTIEAFGSVRREELLYKFRRKGISDYMVTCIKEIYDWIKFCVKCGE